MLITDSSRPAARLAALIAFVAVLAGVILAGMLACKHSGFCTADLGCTVDGRDGCKDLGESPDSRIFFGAGPHIAWFGLFYYLLLLGLLGVQLLSAQRRPGLTGLVVALLVFGGVYDLFLAYKNFFVFERHCALCAYSYIATLVALVAAIVLLRADQKTKDELGAAAMIKAALSQWYIFVGALVLTLIVAGVFSLSAAPAEGGGRDSRGGIPLLSAERRAAVLQEFGALPQAPELNTSGLDMAEGPADAAIVIHEFADFQCPHCRHASEAIRYLQQRWPGRLRVYYRNFPLDATCNPQVTQSRGGYSCNGAQAAICAPEQNIFPQIYHGIFAFQQSNQLIGLRELENLTVASGGNWSQLLTCMGSAATQQKLRRDINDAGLVKVEATPTLVIQGRSFRGAPPIEWFTAVIDAMVIEKEGSAAESDFASRNPL